MNRAAPWLLVSALLAAGPAQKATAPVEPPIPSPTAGKPALRMPEPQAMPEPDTVEQPPASADTPQPFNAAAYRSLVKQAQASLQQQDWAQAGRELEQALAMKPDAREVAYNLGVARFQQGDYTGAAKSFQQSAQASNAKLAARSMYNQGNSIYAQTLKTLPELPQGAGDTAATPQMAPEALQQAAQQVEQAFTHFKDAAAANPSDEDSAANAETSLRLLKELRKLQERQQKQQEQNKDKQKQDPKDQQQQQQPQQQQPPPSEDQKSDQDQQDQQQQQGQGQPDQRQRQEKSQPQSGGENQPQSKDQPTPDQKQQDPKQDGKNEPKAQPKGSPKQEPKPQGQDQKQEGKDPKPQQPRDQKAQDQQQPQSGQPGQAAQGQQAQGQPSGMDRQQADQLLQMVRDKEKERSAQKRQAAGQARQTPVDRDW